MMEQRDFAKICAAYGLTSAVHSYSRTLARTRGRRSSWAKNWLRQRDQFSHMPLLREIQENNPDDIRNFLRMTDPVFHRLLDLMSPYITRQDTDAPSHRGRAEAYCHVAVPGDWEEPAGPQVLDRHLSPGAWDHHICYH